MTAKQLRAKPKRLPGCWGLLHLGHRCVRRVALAHICTIYTIVCLSFHYMSEEHVHALKGLAQPQACRAGDVSAALCLQVAAGELAAATRLRLRQALSRTLVSQK